MSRAFFFRVACGAMVLAACVRTQSLLPQALYYLSGSPGSTQVWRLDPTGKTAEQLTAEDCGVDDFSVSPADGSLALISCNQLILLERDGGDRRVIADGTLAEAVGEEAWFRTEVSSPVFSPDGKTLAYAFDGLHLYDLDSVQDQHVLTNLGNLLGESFVFAKENYYPYSWSPDGSQLLFSMGYYEGSTLAIMEPGLPQPFRRLWSMDGAVCCSYHWTPDGKSILVANPWFSTIWPGLWRYDAQTGEEFDLVATQPGERHFVGWPLQLASGDLLFFHGEKFTPEEGIPLTLVRSGPEGMDRVQVRPEEFQFSTALWAEDGSLVLIKRCPCPTGVNSDLLACQVVLVYPDERDLQVLIEADWISHLTWGR